MTQGVTSSALLLEGQVAVVTGASGGIGRAIVALLARQGAAVCASGRNPERLAETVKLAQLRSRLLPFAADLLEEHSIERFEQFLSAEFGRVDILVHCAGMLRHNLMEKASVEDLDLQYAADLRMPYVLTQRLLSMLKQSQGQIVFINSSLAASARRPEVGQYAAVHHGLKAIADSLREEVNPSGIRILSVYPGRTATPLQKRIYEQEGKHYRPETLLQPEDIASVVINSLVLPRTAEVTDIHIRPMRKT